MTHALEHAERYVVPLRPGELERTSLTQAGLHVVGGHEAVEAQALVHPRGVGALAPVADVRALQTLIDV